MVTVILFTKAPKEKQPKSSSADEWFDKMWYIYTMEYYSVIKVNEVPTYATTWINLKNMVSERRQTQKG